MTPARTPLAAERSLDGSRIMRDGLPRGSPAPAFRLPTIEGSTVALEDFLGRRLFIVFTDPRCGPCKTAIDGIVRLAAAPGSGTLGAAVLAIGRGDVNENREIAAHHGVMFPVAVQEGWKVSKAFGLFVTPAAFLLDGAGTIVAPPARGADEVLALAQRALSNRRYLLDPMSRVDALRVAATAGAWAMLALRFPARVGARGFARQRPRTSGSELAGCKRVLCVKSRDESQQLSGAGLDFIKREEGKRLKLYNDQVGHCTIGYGHLVHKGACNGKDPSEAPFMNGITDAQATDLLAEDVASFEKAINDGVSVDLDQPQFDALVDFAFNAGKANFRKSTLRAVINCGDFDEVPNQLGRWVHASGKTLRVLVNRRGAETVTFQSGAVHGIECGTCTECDQTSGTCVPVECGSCLTCDPITGNCVPCAAVGLQCCNGECRPSCAQKIYCNCNNTCYDDIGTCLANCHVTLGCFTGICGPAEPGQC